MLSELRIKNFAIIDQLQMQFGKGFNCLTGETGAGKSILVDALNLLLGSRSSPEMIRTGEEDASVEAFFDLTESKEWPVFARMGIETSEGLLIKRLISRAGKSRAYLNGNAVTLHMLEEIGEDLVHIYGQHEHQHFLDPARHIDILDQAGKLLPWRQAFQEVFTRWSKARDDLRECTAKQKERMERLDLLSFQSKEIAQAGLHTPRPNEPDEEAELSAERSRLIHAEKLHTLAQQGFEALDGETGPVLQILKSTLQRLRDGTKMDPALKVVADTLESALFQAQDVASSLRSYLDRVHFDPQRLDLVESRLHEIQKLKKKYGPSVAEILAYQEKIDRERAALETLEDRIAELGRENSKLWKEVLAAGEELSRQRQKIGKELGKRVEQELSTLGMRKARFAVEIRQELEGASGEEREAAPRITDQGIDQVQFLISPNPGEDLKPLDKIASGGELSRIMLAVKSIFSGEGGFRTLVFDEVDAGIGGGIAEVVGRKLKTISEVHQVFCITHLAQIASLADFHYRVSKKAHGGRTTVEVIPLEGPERMEEIARMIGGIKMTEKTLEHAREMLRIAKKG